MNTDLINKVKALLSKTTEAGCTEAEAQAAVAMANKLITQHNLSLEEVKNTTDEDIWGEGKIMESGKFTLNIGLAVSVVENYFFVKSVLFKNQIRGVGRGFKLCFYGKKENVITAKYVFDGLIYSFDNLWNQYRKKTKCESKYKKIFISKVAEGFSDKLKIDRYNMVKDMDSKKSDGSVSTAIIIRDVQQRTSEKFKHTYQTRSFVPKFSAISYDDSIANDGYNAGRKLNINRPINCDNRKLIE